MVRLTVFTIRLGLLFFTLAGFGQAVNSSPEFALSIKRNTITTLSPSATALGQAIQQIVAAQGVGAASQSINPSAIAVAQAATAPAPEATQPVASGSVSRPAPFDQHQCASSRADSDQVVSQFGPNRFDELLDPRRGSSIRTQAFGVPQSIPSVRIRSNEN
jgi:hypothetical protein